MKPIDWEEHQRLVERGFTTDLEFWLFANITEGQREWRDLRWAVGNRASCGMYRVARRGGATFVKGPSNTLVLESEAMRVWFVDRLSPAQWHTIGSLDGKDEEDCRTDH